MGPEVDMVAILALVVDTVVGARLRLRVLAVGLTGRGMCIGWMVYSRLGLMGLLEIG